MKKLPIHLAPLQGYTEDAYRRLHHQIIGGVARYYSPFVRLEKGEVRHKDLRDIQPQNNLGIPFTPQVIAADADELQRLLDTLLPLGYTSVDINMGCPFPLQTRHGKGAGILPHPDRVAALCSVVSRHPEVDFSVKMRLGLSAPDEWEQLMPLLNDTPFTHLTLHPRIAAQQYKGTADREVFARILEASRHPVVYNGDLTTRAQMERLAADFPSLAGIMLGRGILARPSLAREYVEGKDYSEAEVKATLRRLHDRLLAHYQQMIPGEAAQVQKMRTFWDFCEPTLGRKEWKKIVKAGNLKNYLRAVDEVVGNY